MVATGIALLGLCIAVGVFWYLKTGCGWGKGEVPFLIGIAAVTALAIMFLVVLGTERVAKNRGVTIPGLQNAVVVIAAGWACIAIPGLFVMAATNLYTKIIAGFGGLLPFVVFLMVWGRRR